LNSYAGGAQNELFLDLKIMAHLIILFDLIFKVMAHLIILFDLIFKVMAYLMVLNSLSWMGFVSLKISVAVEQNE
jgi:hypothetical protein